MDESTEVLAIAEQRRARLRTFLREQGLDGILISRRDNFAWLTCGGANSVLRMTEFGSATALVTREKQYLIAYTMDCGRILEEQIVGQGYEPVVCRWYEDDPATKASKLLTGTFVSDLPLSGMRTVDLTRMHGPLAPLEMERCRSLGAATAAAFETVVKKISPGMSEIEISRLLGTELMLRDLDAEVLITGSDERIGRYWHALPSSKRVEQYALIHAAAGKWGLHACVNRLISFSEPPEWVRHAHDAAKTILARVLSMIREGTAYRDILKCQKDGYAELGFEDDWKLHFQGGAMGYYLGDPLRCTTDMHVENEQAFDWFITVRGVQTEELILLTEGMPEIASRGERWPCSEIETRTGIVTMPDIYVL
ncbi:MAG: aminopeptidase P family protein [Bacillota bacterium]